jgi:hypothetical protein
MAQSRSRKKRKTTKSVANDKESFDPVAWATGSKAYAPRQCRTCKEFPQVVGPIQVVLETWAGGVGEVNIRGLLRMLHAEYGYSLSDTAIRNHVQLCEHELWEQVKSGGTGRFKEDY